MRLPKTQTEDRPFLSTNLKMPHKSKDNFTDPSKYHKIENSAKSNKFLSIINKLWSNNLIRWLLLVAILLVIFVVFSNSVGQIFTSHNPYMVTEIPELDFNLANLISASIGLSTLAAESIVQIKNDHSEHPRITGVTKEGVEEPVTMADHSSNSIIINGFKTLFSHSKAIDNEDGNNKIPLHLISEEHEPKYEEIVPLLEYIEIGNKNEIGDRLLDPNKISIIIDPLDATKEFTEEKDTDGTNMLPYVSILICIVEDGKPIAGVINRPFVKEKDVNDGKNVGKNDGKKEYNIYEDIVWAVVETKEIHGMKVKRYDNDYIAVSRSHTGNAGKMVDKVLHKKALYVGGAGYKSYLVVSGKADAYVHLTSIKTWDICAGHALIKAGGGCVTDIHGNEILYSKTKEDSKLKNGLIASLSCDMNEKFIKLLKDL